MQDHDWNDLKYVLALHRTGDGDMLRANETTVARRHHLGFQAFDRMVGDA